ncbi:hypothetical protein LCGC14_3034450 [marine sediment metagenome]|uniref:Uncharacterized protein n=1 Tax=marine sediment metagenome TaxID=412755 RepID=A0A0F8WS03_9ZZZZ
MYLLPESYEKRLLASIGFSEEEPSILHPIKSEYQRNLEEKGWEFITKVEAENKFMNYTENRESFRLLREDCRNKFCPGKKIKLARAYNQYGEKIPSEEKIVDVYAKDRE